jgi:hypothetical protein
MTLFQMRPEIPGKKGRSMIWHNPWVTWRHERPARRGAPFILTVSPARGLRHDPARSKAKMAAKRLRQSKDRR